MRQDAATGVSVSKKFSGSDAPILLNGGATPVGPTSSTAARALVHPRIKTHLGCLLTCTEIFKSTPEQKLHVIPSQF